ncbi:MAG: peroxiredoxin [Methylococcales bacterium]
MNPINIGDAVTNFVALSTGDKSINLSDFLGRYVVLYFYPKDSTPGCTQEGIAFRDSFEKFNALNTVILGVSRDSIRMHENFKAKQAFPFDLLSDPDEALCTLFDVIKMKAMYGKQVRGIERSTFLIDPNGVLIHEWRKVKVKEHCEDVLSILSKVAELPAL